VYLSRRARRVSADDGFLGADRPGYGHGMDEPDWKRLALALAEHHAGTMEYDGSLSSTSRVRRRRLAAICLTAADAIEGQPWDDDRVLDGVEIADRLRRAVDAQP